MGRISEYNRNSFASSYVGGPQVDQSGTMIVEGVSKAVTPVVESQAKVLRERELAQIDQQADNAFMKYSLALQTEAQALQVKYADNPDEFPPALMARSQELAQEYADTIGDERIRARFTGAAGTLNKQSISPAVNWTAAKKAENARIAYTDNMRLPVIQAGKMDTPDGLVNSIVALRNITNSATFVPADVREKDFQTQATAATVAYFNRQVTRDPLAFARDLEAGVYDELNFTDDNGKENFVPVTAEMKNKYTSLAKEYYTAKQREKDFDKLVSSTGQAFDLAQAYDKGEATLTDILNTREIMERDGTPQEVKDATDALLRIAYSSKADSALLDNYALNDTYAEVAELKKTLAKGTRGTGKKQELKSPEKYTTQILETLTNLRNRVAEGKISRKDGAQIEKELISPMMQSVSRQSGTSFFGFIRPDPYSEYYGAINAKVDNFDLTQTDKLNARVRAYSNFVKQVVEAKETGAEISPEQYRNFANSAIQEVNNIYFPKASAAMTDETANAIANRQDAVTSIHNNPTDLKATSSVGTYTKPKLGSKMMRNGVEYVATETGWKKVGK